LLDIADGFVRNHTQAFPARQRSVSKPRRASVSRVVITAARPDDLTATATLRRAQPRRFLSFDEADLMKAI